MPALLRFHFSTGGDAPAAPAWRILMPALAGATRLLRLEMRDCGLGAREVPDLAHTLAQLPWLHSLGLARNKLDRGALERLSGDALRGMTGLSMLDLCAPPSLRLRALQGWLWCWPQPWRFMPP